jgi:outer membrane protein TolC
LNLFAEGTNLGQAGPVNTLPPIGGTTGSGTGSLRTVSPIFVGGYGTYLGQIFGRDFPDYRVGVQLNIPLRNRAAQADYAHDSLSLRQSQIDLQKQMKQIRTDVQNALIGLQQARARYQAATEQRILEEQTLDAEQKKYALGASTVYNVIQIQRDLATAQGSEVTALSQYAHAKVTLEVATGQVLGDYNVDLGEAQTGHVARPPAPPPVLAPQGANPTPPLQPGTSK